MRTISKVSALLATLTLSTVALVGCSTADNGRDIAGNDVATAQESSAPAATASEAPAAAEEEAPSGPEAFKWGGVATWTGTNYDDTERNATVTVGAPVAVQPGEYDSPATRGQFVYLPVTIENKSAAPLDYNAFDFQLLLADGQRPSDIAFVTEMPAGAPSDLSSGTLNAGEKVVGSLVYDVPADNTWKLAFAPLDQVLGTWSA